jgi:hypothetical protein
VPLPSRYRALGLVAVGLGSRDCPSVSVGGPTRQSCHQALATARHSGKRAAWGSRSVSAVPSRRYLRSVVWLARLCTWGFPLIMFLALCVVFGIKHAWLAMAIFGSLACLWTMTLVWRVRSGIKTWTMTATFSAVVAGVRPTRDGLTRPTASSGEKGNTLRSKGDA